MYQLSKKGIFRGIHYDKSENGEMYPEDLKGIVAAEPLEKQSEGKQEAIQNTIDQLRKETGIK